MGRLRQIVYVFSKLADRDLESRGDTYQIEDTDVTFPALDAANVGAVQPGPMCKLFLGKAISPPVMANLVAQPGQQRIFHSAILWSDDVFKSTDYK